MNTLALKEGATFADRYRIVRRIACGGMGDVYEAIHIETDRKCALKIMLPHMFTSERMRQRFRQEARIAANIDSEFIVTVFDAGIDEATDMPFLVMELLRGEELKKRLQRAGAFSPDEVVTYLYQTALALAKTHKASIIHRDLKPDNLFLTEREDGSPRIKVLDFGIAKILACDGAQPNITYEMMGTPFYMAPEQFRVDPGISFAADIHSLGMIAYTLLVGVPYWKEEVATASNAFVFFAAFAIHGSNEPATVRARRFGVTLPPAFDAWFSRATAVFPEDRHPSALTAVRMLADALGVPRPGQAPLLGASSVAAPINQTVPMLPRPPQPLANQKPPSSRPSSAQSEPSVAAPRSAPPPYTSLTSAPPMQGYAALDKGSHTLSAGTTVPLGSPTQSHRLFEVAGLAGIAVAIGFTLFLFLARDPIRARVAGGSRQIESAADVRAPSIRPEINRPRQADAKQNDRLAALDSVVSPPAPPPPPALTPAPVPPPSPVSAVSAASKTALSSDKSPKRESIKMPQPGVQGAKKSASAVSGNNWGF